MKEALLAQLNLTASSKQHAAVQASLYETMAVTSSSFRMVYYLIVSWQQLMDTEAYFLEVCVNSLGHLRKWQVPI